MRIIRLKLETKTKEYIRILAQRVRSTDYTLLEDLYALCRLRGNGLPDDASCQKITDFYSKVLKQNSILVSSLVRKRRQVLHSIILTSMFSAWIKDNCVRNALEFLEDLVTSFRSLTNKLQASQCLTCNLKSNCEFGKQYGARVRNIAVVLDPDYSKKVHEDCPSLPSIQLANELYKAAQFAQNLANQHNASALAPSAAENVHKYSYEPPDELSISEKEMSALSKSELSAQEQEYELDGQVASFNPDEFVSEETPEAMGFKNFQAGKFSSQFDAGQLNGIPVILDEALIKRISVQQLALYEIAMKLDSLLNKTHKGKFRPVEKLTKERKQARIKSISEAHKVTASQHALPDAVFDVKLAKKELTKNQQEEPDSKKQLLYLLVDVSDSMNSQIGTNAIFGYLSRATLSVAFCLALCKRVKEDKGIIFFRPFTGSAGPLRTCRTPAEFDALQLYLSRCDYNGMSTKIVRALNTAIDDISKAKDELANAEILIVTDACDNIDKMAISEIRHKLGKKIVLDTLDVSGEDSNQLWGSTAMTALQELSDHYFKFDNAQTALDKMVSLVGNKSKKGLK